MNEKEKSAEAKGDAIVREARAHLRRNNPPINLMPLYYRYCPELKQFDQLTAFAIVREANRAIRPGLGGTVGSMLLGAVVGAMIYAYPVALWIAVPALLLWTGSSFWRLRRKIAALCAEHLP